jgi:Spy/CpxP family protein refolding chaperone
MSRIFRLLGASALAASLCLVPALRAEPSKELRDLHSQVRTLKLLRELQLTPVQLQQLRSLAQQAADIRAQHEKDLQDLQAQVIARLNEEKQQLVQGTAAADEKSGPRADGSLRDQFREVHKQIHDQMQPLVEQVRGLLTPEQTQQLKDLARKHGRHGFRPGRRAADGEREGRKHEGGEREGRERGDGLVARWLARDSTLAALEALDTQTTPQGK